MGNFNEYCDSLIIHKHVEALHVPYSLYIHKILNYKKLYFLSHLKQII